MTKKQKQTLQRVVESWVLNEDTCRWDSPVPHPTDGKDYVWNENKREWEEVVVHGE